MFEIFRIIKETRPTFVTRLGIYRNVDNDSAAFFAFSLKSLCQHCSVLFRQQNLFSFFLFMKQASLFLPRRKYSYATRLHIASGLRGTV